MPCIPALSNNERNQDSIDFLCTAVDAVRMLPSSAFLVFEFPRQLEVSPSPAEGSAHAISVTIEYQVRLILCAPIVGDVTMLFRRLTRHWQVL